LHYAAAHSTATEIDAALNAGDAIDAQTAEGQTALHLAYKHAKTENAVHLIRKGANTQILDDAGKRPKDYDTSIV
jgi:ankyrin repeat protein